MIKTTFGTFDGDSWEAVCQICFKQNFREEAYQEIKATPGDYGIEGFTRSGKAFQCYCPDEMYNSDKLYEKQRDKITSDLNKLKLYENVLASYLGTTKINKWYFVSPLCGKNEIIAHCTKKKEEVKKWGLSIIDNDNFEIIFEEINFLHPHLAIALDATSQKINFSTGEVADGDRLIWKDQEISLVSNAQKKHQQRFTRSDSKIDAKVDSLTEQTVASFLNGNTLLRIWQEEYPIEYEKFLSIISIVEKEVEEKCMFPVEDKNELYFSFKTMVEAKLVQSFPKLDTEMIMRLTHHVLADWILRCPISFDE